MKPREYFNEALNRWVVFPEPGRQQYRYRWIMEQHLGRPLATDEHVHHINGDQTDDRLENLEVLSAVDHGRLHGRDLSAKIRSKWEHPWSARHACCVNCGTTDHKHTGHGLCSPCYYRAIHEAKRTGPPREYARIVESPCAWCGEAFAHTTRRGHKTHCSRSCAAKTTAEKAWKTRKAAA